MNMIKVSKTDYTIMKNMLLPYLTREIAYNGKSYRFMNYCEYAVNNILIIECVLCIENETITIPIIEMVRICCPDVIIY